MNKLLFLGILLVNGLTLYYIQFASISAQDMATYHLAHQVLNENHKIIDHNNYLLRSKVYVEQDKYDYKACKKIITQMDSIQAAYRNIIEVAEDINKTLKETNQILRQKEPFKKLLETIAIQQNIIVQELDTVQWLDDWKNQHYLDTALIKMNLSKPSAIQVSVELQMLIQQCYAAITYCMETFPKMLTPIFDFDNILPIIAAEKNTIQLGDTYKATISLAKYGIPIQDSLLQVKVNGTIIPIKKGIATYNIPINKIGTYPYHIEYAYYEDWMENDERKFEYKVIDCK